tara:strand:- start:1180 stop:1953 length:774 start_codon:yes stop_codon:yes gene_type:complete
MNEYPYTFQYSQMSLINKIINKFIKKNQIDIFEIGSRDCADAFFLCSLNNKLRVISFDANPTFLELAKPFISSCSRIHAIETIISSKKGKVPFFLTRNYDDDDQGRLGSASSSILEPNLNIKGLPVKSFHKIFVNSITGSEAIQEFGIPQAIILDVQGAEIDVLRSFENKLSQIELIFTEVNFKKDFIYSSDEGALRLIKYLRKKKFYLFNSYNISSYSGDLIFSKNKNIILEFIALFKILFISQSKLLIKRLLGVN